MSETITMTEDKIHLLLTSFAVGGAMFGYIMGRALESMRPKDQPKKQRRKRRTPAERHTRSHW